MNFKQIAFITLASSVYFHQNLVLADEEGKESANKRDEEYYSGREVELSNGKKVKHWSTKGPVPVTQPSPLTPLNGLQSNGLQGSNMQLPAGVILNVDNDRSREKPR